MVLLNTEFEWIVLVQLLPLNDKLLLNYKNADIKYNKPIIEQSIRFNPLTETVLISPLIDIKIIYHIL